MNASVITLPEIPNREMFVENEQFLCALAAWQAVCRQVVLRSDNVQPPAMPRRELYLTTEQYLLALSAWQGIFTAARADELFTFHHTSHMKGG